MEAEPNPFEDDEDILSIVQQIEEVIETQEYCPFVVVAITKYIHLADGDKFI